MPVAMQRGAVVAKRYLKPLSFHSTNGGMPEHLARSAMVMRCYQELVPVMGLTLYAGDFNCAAGQAPPSHTHAHARDAHAHAHACAAHACADSTRSIHCAPLHPDHPDHQVVGERGDPVGVYVSNELRRFKKHDESLGREGFSAQLNKYVLDARHDPTGVALINESGRVNVFMVPVDLTTEDGDTVAVYGFFLARRVHNGDELRTDYGPSYQVVRDLKGYGGKSEEDSATEVTPPYFTAQEQAKLPDVLLASYNTDGETRTTFEHLLKYAGVWDEEEPEQTRGVGELPPQRTHPGLEWP